MSSVRCEQVVHEYAGPLRALDGVSLELPPGELLAVIGPNGAGKSTLLKVLAGLVEPTSGRVTLDGRPIAGWSARERARRIAVVPQELRALPEVSVRHFVLGGRYGHFDRWRRRRPADDAAVAEALAAADVADVGGRLLTEISGGQRQRVLIARSLAQQAGTLLVDEPTTALDPEHQIRVFSLLARLTALGRAVMVVTHDLNLASQFATSLLLLDAGREVARGTPRVVLTRAVLEPVYGRHLRYGAWPGPRGDGEVPVVVPWQRPDE